MGHGPSVRARPPAWWPVGRRPGGDPVGSVADADGCDRAAGAGAGRAHRDVLVGHRQLLLLPAAAALASRRPVALPLRPDPARVPDLLPGRPRVAMGGGAGPVLERGLLDVVVDVGAVPLLSVVRGVGAGREGVDLVAGAGAHPLV